MNYEKRPGLFRTSIRNDVKTRNLSEKKRRDQFNMLINELCSMVSTNNRKMDKSTVLKSTIAFLKNYQEISVQSQAHEIKENWKPPFLSNDEFTQLMLEALDSFLLVFSQQGSILYASESVTSLLGHLPNNIVNRSIFDLIHEDDKMNLYNLISTHGSRDQDEASPSDTGAVQFSLRCHLKRGLLLPSDEQIYEFVHLAGNVRVWNGDPAGSAIDSDDESFFSNKSTDTMCFCCTVRLETSQLIREMSAVDEVNTQFTSRHSMEWKFLFLDHRAPPIIGYLPFELLGTSGYDYYHPEDLEKISSCHEQLMLTGEGKSCPYRFLTKGQQWIWLKTRFFITYHQWNCKPEFIVCTHTLISYADVCAQLRNDDDLDDGDGESSRCRSPSAYSVTSAGQGRCKMSSTTSQQSNSPGPHGSGRDTPQKPHSTAHPSPRASLPSESSPHSTLQPPVQGILVPAEMFVSPPSPNVQPQARVLSPLVPQSPSSTASMPVCSSTVTNPPTSPLPAQLFLTPAQSHLHKQLQQKSQLLQQAILQQQAELQQINSQLAQAKSSMLPLPPAQSTGPDTGGDRHWVLGAPPAFPQYSPFSTYGGGVMAVTTTQPMPPTPPLPATLGQPAPLVQPLLPPVSLTQPSQPQPSENQDQLFPYQFLQPQQDLYSHSHMNSMGHPPNPLD